ncbi:LON peptidase substrate-binding domain-containing protein [Photobacterium sagamiensis]|uniref:LON peptidase substrate-binding domain-containing protein n=1 Tax=Photobacterium sagamiensis TaxID=2910241 RepID=UPI003D131BAC
MTQSIPLLFQKRHVLPTGRMPIRIAPGSQTAAFKVALSSTDGFGVCMLDENNPGQHFFHIGTRVTVEDFDTSTQDGSLIVTVYGHDNFRIKSLTQDNKGVFSAEYRTIPQWAEIKLHNNQRLLAVKLRIMFEKYPELDRLHQAKEFNNLSWLCQRWLELLPVPACEKQALLNTPNCLDTCDYLMSMMQEPH